MMVESVQGDRTTLKIETGLDGDFIDRIKAAGNNLPPPPIVAPDMGELGAETIEG